MDSVRVVGLMNGRAAPPGGAPAGVRLGTWSWIRVLCWYGICVYKWSMYFHTPWGVHDHLRSLRTCAFTPLAAIVSQSHQPFRKQKTPTPLSRNSERRQPSCGFDAHATSATESRTGPLRLLSFLFSVAWGSALLFIPFRFYHDLPQPRPPWLPLPRSPWSRSTL